MQTSPVVHHQEPGPENDYLASHVVRLLASLRHWAGRDLVDRNLPPGRQARPVRCALCGALAQYRGRSAPELRQPQRFAAFRIDLGRAHRHAVAAHGGGAGTKRKSAASIAGVDAGFYRRLFGNSRDQERPAVFDRAGDGVESFGRERRSVRAGGNFQRLEISPINCSDRAD
jgi:hypothetical protein